MPTPPITNLRTDPLPANTQALLAKVIHYPEMIGFRLIGGTALTLQVAHRQSEDIDLCWMGDKLPRPAIDKLIAKLVDEGFQPLLSTYETTRLYWENEGTDLDDFQQDWMVDGVKLSLAVMIDNKLPDVPDIPYGFLNIVPADSIFVMKAHLLVSRTTIRDLYDIWYFLTHGGKTIHQVVKAMQQANPYYSESMIRRRLQPSKASMADPGVHPLLPDAPADFEAIKAALLPHVAEWERVLAARVIANELG